MSLIIKQKYNMTVKENVAYTSIKVEDDACDYTVKVENDIFDENIHAHMKHSESLPNQDENMEALTSKAKLLRWTQ